MIPSHKIKKEKIKEEKQVSTAKTKNERENDV